MLCVNPAELNASDEYKFPQVREGRLLTLMKHLIAAICRRFRIPLRAPGLCALLWLACSCPAARAQGTAFTYQGHLLDRGVAATGAYDFRFRLAADALANTYVGGVVLTNGLPVTNGLFAATVDFGTAPFTGASYWLEVDVRTNGASTYTVVTPLQALTPAPYAIFATTSSNLSGTVGSAQLGGFYANQVSFTNAGNSFAGNGSGLTSVNASSLNGLTPASFWRASGNGGTTPGAQFVGTTDNQPLELKVNGFRALRLEPSPNNFSYSNCVNVIGGSLANVINSGLHGVTIGGGGGWYNFSGSYLSLANVASVDLSTIAGGELNFCSGFVGAIGGGSENTNSGVGGTIAGGESNLSGGDGSAVGGGQFNISSGSDSTVGGGYNNAATNQYATVPGGYYNVAGGKRSFAVGQYALALHDGSFVWSDGMVTPFATSGANQFLVHAAGGVGINLNNPTDAALSVGGLLRLNDSNLYFRTGTDRNHGLGYYGGTRAFASDTGIDGPVLFGYTGGRLGIEQAGTEYIALAWTATSVSVYGTFNNNSDRNAKERIEPVNPSQVLEEVLRVPVSEWSYKVDPVTRHMGPMAQDFHSALGLGTDERHIAPIDEGGVAIAAIQGLNQKVDELKTELSRRNLENAELKQRLDALEKAVRRSAL